MGRREDFDTSRNHASWSFNVFGSRLWQHTLRVVPAGLQLQPECLVGEIWDECCLTLAAVAERAERFRGV